ncbi:MAG: ISAzo13-like element transposase-related protein [Acidiferrobacterales bacterium]
MSTTKTRTGLNISAVLNSRTYETGETVTDKDIERLRIRPHKISPEWNYTIKPQIWHRRT